MNFLKAGVRRAQPTLKIDCRLVWKMKFPNLASITDDGERE
jgi:hypothetical protein